MTDIIRLEPYSQFQQGGVPGLLVEQGPLGVIISRWSEGEIVFDELTYDEISTGLKSGKLVIQDGYHSEEAARQRVQFADQIVTHLPAKQRATVFFRQAWCDLFLDAEARGEIGRYWKDVEIWIRSVAQEITVQIPQPDKDAGKRKYGGKKRSRDEIDPPGSSSLLRWVRAYQAGNRCILALIDKRYLAGRTKVKFGPESAALLRKCADRYASFKRPSKKSVIRQTKRAFRLANAYRINQGLPPLAIPAESTIYREICRLEPYHVMCQRQGLEAANRHFAIIGEGLNVLRPGERLEIDEWKVDLITFFAEAGVFGQLTEEQIKALPKGRRWIYVVIDVRTRLILSVKVCATPKAEDAIAALDLATRDKADLARLFGCALPDWPGTGFETVASDQGTAFANFDFRGAVTDLRGTVMFPPAGVPKLRGHIERCFRTFGVELMECLSARTYSNIVEKGDFEPEDYAALADDELTRILVRFVVDVYNNKPHGGIGGQTPLNCWRELCSTVGKPRPPSRIERLGAFGRKYTRSISGRGVRFAGIFYTCELVRHHFLSNPDLEVEIRVDHQDLGLIEVNLDGVWVVARPLAKGFDGLSLDLWTEACTNLRRRFEAEAELTQDIIDQAFADFSEEDRAASQRLGLSALAPTKADVERNREHLWLGLEVIAGIAPTVSRKKRALLDGVIAKAEVALPQVSAKTPENDDAEKTMPVSRPRWRMEDGQ
ncbi:hypothetical protein [Litorivita sp. NS0012-18]|uniref:hypothetical protein n=1 Tax=Litorivita sp. NS0012-18 TaxID=3127655 RepID=UPI003103E225